MNMLYAQLYELLNIDKYRMGNMAILTRINVDFRSCGYDNVFQNLDKLSNYQIKGDGKRKSD